MNGTLRGYRVMMGLSQTEIGEKIGMSNTAYSMKESGKRQFKQNEMHLITEIIKTKYSDTTMEIIFKKE